MTEKSPSPPASDASAAAAMGQATAPRTSSIDDHHTHDAIEVSSSCETTPSDDEDAQSQHSFKEAQASSLTMNKKEALTDPSTSVQPVLTSQEPSTEEHKDVEDGRIAGKFNAQTNYLPRSRIIIIFMALSVVTFIVLLDQSTLAVAAAEIGTELDAGSLTAFITGAYFLTSTSFQLLYGRLSDLFGRKPLMLIFLAMFFIGHLGSSLSPNAICLICFRAFTGIWGGGLLTLGQTVISDVVTLRERGKYQGILGCVMVIANCLGPILGGTFVEKATWRDIYRMMLPLTALAAVVTWKFLPLKPVVGDWKAKAAALDYIGAVLTFIATTLLVLGLSWAGGSYSWSDAHVLAPLILGVFFAILFCLWQWKGATEARPPLLPLWMFRSRLVCGAAVTQCINGWLFYGQIYYIPQFYQLCYGYSPIVAGALLLPQLCIQSMSSTLSGLIVTKTGRYREILLSGWALWSIGLGLFSSLDEHSGKGKQIGFALLTGFGVGQTLQVALVALQGAVPRNEMAVVTSMRNFVRMLGAAIGIAVASTIVNTVTINRLEPMGWTAAMVRAALNDPAALFHEGSASSSTTALTLSPAQIEQLRSAYTEGFRINFILLSSLAALGFVVTLLLMGQKKLERDDDEALKEQAKKEEAERKAKKRAGKTGLVDLEKQPEEVAGRPATATTTTSKDVLDHHRDAVLTTGELAVASKHEEDVDKEKKTEASATSVDP